MDPPSKTILVAEDNPALAQIATFNLQRAGYEVTVASNGLEAWEILSRESFQLVITDQQMPEMSGWELCETMRRSVDHAQTPVVFITAKGLELNRQQLQEELRVSRVFSKPYSPRELVQAVNDIFSTELAVTLT